MTATSDKQTLRAEMRRLRNALADRELRSTRIFEQVRAHPAVLAADRLLVFDSIPGEPDTASFVEWCRAAGKQVAAPEAAVDPSWPEVVVVPGLAFTPAGDRLGQGGGWFDRFLAQTNTGCTTIGVCFAPQVLDDVPTEAHDIVVDVVITD